VATRLTDPRYATGVAYGFRSDTGITPWEAYSMQRIFSRFAPGQNGQPITEDGRKFFHKWLMATLAGAATMVVWGGISPMVLLNGVGFSHMSNEERIVSTLRTSLPGDGLSFFPRMDFRRNPTGEETAAWEAMFCAGPTRMIIYHHEAGDASVSPKNLSVQLLSDVLAARIVSYLLSLTIATY